MTTSPRFLLHGSGAIGTVYVYLLTKAGFDVTAVCRSNYPAAKANGFSLDSDVYGKDLRFHPKVVRTPAEAAKAGVYDYVLVTTKSLPEAETSKVIAPVVSKGKTTIVLIQNGIGIENEFASAFPSNPLISCVVYLPTTQISPGHVTMGNLEKLELGTYPATAYNEHPRVKDAADQFLHLMRQAGSQASWLDDIQERRWNKLLINASWNPVCALTLSRDVAFLESDPSAGQLVEAVMGEVVEIAQRLGYPSISKAAAHEQMKRAGSRVGGKGIEPSMLVDRLNERRLEVEVILGNPVRIAQELGIAVPRLALLYGLAKALDNATALRQPGKSLAGGEKRAALAKGGGSTL